VIESSESAAGCANFASRHPHRLERLRRSDLVNQMEVYIKERRFTWCFTHDMTVPNLFEECLRRHSCWDYASGELLRVSGLAEMARAGQSAIFKRLLFVILVC